MKTGDFTAIFLINFGLHFRWYRHIQRLCSEMAEWIHLKRYNKMPSYPEIIPMYLDFERNENGQFYGHVSYRFSNRLNKFEHYFHIFNYRRCKINIYSMLCEALQDETYFHIL